ncbi:PLP-dependent cysteine synthase family protein [Sphingomonas sp. Leaf21]|uniref:PLP-dependent cysteine synthase family protein n=1 Tax=Sphingomonas sp. Leaf21 TaxID=2876550 RepID=UPI001E467500|nr:pyridoxal-phosphate dependent enzyme [Sphingomonas sp. Leaf21]
MLMTATDHVGQTGTAAERLGIVTAEHPVDRAFVARALCVIDRDRRRCPETPLLAVGLAAAPSVDLYLKDESAHPTGSLKHRLARSLFTSGVVAGVIREGRPLVEASSGSTAVSEAYFARLLDLPFHAVMPTTTAPAKIRAIAAQGGQCHLVAPNRLYDEARDLADALGGVYLDQFTNAAPATDWRCDNIASAILTQMAGEPHAVPDWIVVGAGTGGTAATIGRHCRHRGIATRLCVADVERSAFFAGYRDHDPAARCSEPSRIEGVGRPRVEPSFLPGSVDRMMKLPDAVSIAGMRVASELLGRPVGPSTGTNFVAAAMLALDMAAAGRSGSIATLICDHGARYADCHHDPRWLTAQGLAESVDAAEMRLRQMLLKDAE